MFILFTKIQLSLTIPGQVRTELLGLPSLGGFKGGNKKESVGLTLPEGTVFESVDSKQEVACVRDHLSHSCENSQEGFFFSLNVCGVGGDRAVENRFVTKRTKMPRVTSW